MSEEDVRCADDARANAVRTPLPAIRPLDLDVRIGHQLSPIMEVTEPPSPVKPRKPYGNPSPLKPRVKLSPVAEKEAGSGGDAGDDRDSLSDTDPSLLTQVAR